MAYRSLFRFKLLVAIYIRDISTITKSSLFVWLATFTRVIMVTTTTVWVRAGATHSPKAALTLVSRGEGIPTVLADVFPSCEKRGTGQRCWEISLTPKNLRSSSSHFRLVVLHSHMLSQPLFRGCFVLTLVTFWLFRSSCIIKWDPTWRILLLLVQKFSPAPGVPPERWGACPLLDQRTFHLLAPGVHGEGKGGADGNGDVEGLTLAGQRLAKVQALGEHGGVNNVHTSHFGFTSELMRYWSCSSTCCS